MASYTPEAAIEERLRAAWTATPIFLADEIDQAPQPPSPFLVLEFPGGMADQYSLGDPGNNVFLEQGAFMLHVLVPLGGDPSQNRPSRAWALDLAEQASQIFRGQTFATSVVCYAPHPPSDSERSNGNYYGVSFGVPYKYQYLA